MKDDLTPDFVPSARDHSRILEKIDLLASNESAFVLGFPHSQSLFEVDCFFLDAGRLQSNNNRVIALLSDKEEESERVQCRWVERRGAIRRFVLNPHVETLIFNIGEEEIHLSKLEMAVLLGALEAKPKESPTAHLHIHAQDCLQSDKVAEALYWSIVYKSENGVLEAVLETLVSCLSYFSLFADAKAEIATYREPGRNSLDFTPYEARMLTMRGFPNDAISKLKSIFTGFKVSPVAWVERARALLATGQFDGALTALEKALEVDDSLIEAKFLKSRTLLRQVSDNPNSQLLDEAEQLLVDLEPQAHFLLPRITEDLAFIAHLKGNQQTAIRYFKKALSIQPLFESYAKLSSLYAKSGNPDKAAMISSFLAHYYPSEFEHFYSEMPEPSRQTFPSREEVHL